LAIINIQLEKTQISARMPGHYFQESKVLTSISWRHNHIQFSVGFKNNYMPGLNQLSTSLYSQLILRNCAVVWGRPNWFCPRARETLRTVLFAQSHGKARSEWDHFIAHPVASCLLILKQETWR